LLTRTHFTVVNDRHLLQL